MYFLFTGLKQFLHHVTGTTIPKERSVKVDFMVDPNGCMTSHTYAFSIILPRLKFTANEDNFLLFQEALMAVIQLRTKEFNMA